MNKKLSLIFVLVLFMQNSYALETLLFGGGGEPSGESTIFDGSLQRLGAAKNQVGLNIKSSFNGGHKETEDILKNSLGVQNKDFTPENFEKTLAEYAQKIKSGKIAPGEKLLVLLDSHGQPNDSSTEKNDTHMIDMATHGNTRGARLASMDKLKELAQLAKDYKIKLGIVDFSCHSGNSLPLANENTCVVTSTAPNLLGYDDFSNSFYENMKKGESLESVFLKARALTYSPSFPMISTSEGKQLNQSLYPLITPYMFYSNGIANKLTPYLESLYNQGSIGVCKRENEFDLLLKQVEDFQKINGVMRSRYSGEENLLDELKSYKKMQDSFLAKMKALNYGLLKNVEKYYPNDTNKKISENVTWSEALGATQSNLDYFVDNLKSAKPGSELNGCMESIKKLKFSLELKKKITTVHPELQEADGFARNLQNQGEELKKKASLIAQISGKIYDAKYKELKESSEMKKNACSDFVF